MEMRNGKRRKQETGDEKMCIFLHNCMLSLHSATPCSSGADFCHSGEEVETIACTSLFNTQKSIIDRPGCMTSHRTGRAELVCGLDKLVQSSYIFQLSQSIQDSCCTLLLNCRIRCLHKYAATGVQQNARKTLYLNVVYQLVATFTRVWPCFSYYVLATYIYCRLILLWKNYFMEFTPPATVYIQHNRWRNQGDQAPPDFQTYGFAPPPRFHSTCHGSIQT